MANINIKDLIGNGDGMANDVIFTEAQFEWFKSSADGYIYTFNTETKRSTRFNAEGQNGKRISVEVYGAQMRMAKARAEAGREAQEAHEEPAPAEEAPKAVSAPEAKKTKKRAKKNVAFRTTIDGTEITLTDKQVDFIKHLPDTICWNDSYDSVIRVDFLCDEIEGQFEGKPMTVGAMVSTICEKGLAIRTKEKLDGRKTTCFRLTPAGQQVAATLGLW